MIVYDPHAHAKRDYEECEVLSRTSLAVDYTPVRSLKEGRWFALHMPTGISHKFEDLDAYVKDILETRVSTALLIEKLMPALAWIADGLLVPDTSDRSRQFARAEAGRNYGRTSLDSAAIFARYEGYSPDQIANALTCLDEVPPDRVILEGVEITKISTLMEG